MARIVWHITAFRCLFARPPTFFAIFLTVGFFLLLLLLLLSGTLGVKLGLGPLLALLRLLLLARHLDFARLRLALRGRGPPSDGMEW